MSTFDYKITIKKCPCGHSNYDYHGLSDGTFYQGNGWNKATAEEHMRRWNEAMTETRAREILDANKSTRSDSPNRLYGGHEFIQWEPGNHTAELGSFFTPTQLEAIAWWMRNKEAK